MAEGTEIIVLNVTKFSESAVVLHTLSKDYGRRSFMVKGLKRSGRSLMTLFQPMNVLECEIVENPRSSLWVARNFALEYPLEGIRRNPYKNAVTLFLAEVLFKAIKDEAREEGLFEWCRESVLLLDALNEGWSNFHLVFLLSLAVQLGFAPGPEDLRPFTEDDTSTVEKLLGLPRAEALILPLNGRKRNEIAKKLLDYLAFHCESSLNINSLDVLREVFA